MDNTIQLYVDKKKEVKGYPITSPDRVIDENGVNIKEKLDNIVSQLPNDLATKDYVDEAINNAKLEGGDAQVDLSVYAKKTDLHAHSNKTILDSITTSKVNQWDSKSDFNGDYNDLTNKPTIPTKVSDLPNDSGYLTEHQDISGKVDKINGYSLVSDAEISRLATLENYDDTEVRESINETNTSLDNIANRVTTLETNGGGSNLNLRDVVDGEIFKLYGTPDIPSEPDIPTNVPVSSVSLDRSSHELEVGQTIQLTATVLPNNATNKSVTWSASNSNCTVNNGLIKAINSGSCVITCTTVDGNKTASCDITIPVVEPDEPDTPEEPSNPTLIHEWDLTGTGSTIEDKVNNLDLVVNGNKKQISRYDSQGQLDTNFILTETESFSLDILVTPKSVYKEDIIHTGHVGGVNITKAGETSYYRFTLQREVSHGSNKGRLFIDYRLENNTSEQVWIENSQTTKDVQTNIKIVYNADKTEFKVYQEDNLVYTDNRPYKISGFNFTIADYCKVYKGCII